MRNLRVAILILLVISLLSACGPAEQAGSDATSDNPGIDTTKPMVSSVSPSSGSANITVNSAITVTFSEAMDASTINSSTFTLSYAGSNVSGTISCNGSTAMFTPSFDLSYNTTYTATITTGAEDAAGNALANSYSWNFTTGIASDTTPPTVSSTSPTNNATGVAVNSAITATFSENMDSSTITTSTFTLKQGAMLVSGTVAYSGTTATFTPSSSLSYNTTYTPTITTGVKDAAGNPMSSSYSWSFTTGISSDTTPPTVTSANPANGTSGVALNSSITATFSETMDASTITTSTFFISSSNGLLSGTVGYTGTTATFIPSSNLELSTTYTAIITTSVKDISGNAIAAIYSWSFTTGTAPDAPTGVEAKSGDSSVTISWNAVTGATSYNIYWSTTSGVSKTTGSKISNVTSPYIHTGRSNGTTYYYVVTAVNSYGEGTASSQASATSSSSWAKTYGRAYSQIIRQSTDGGYIAAGATYSDGSVGVYFLITKLDPDGNIQWQKTYSETNHDFAYSIQQTPDGGYIVTGVLNDYGSSDKSVSLLKLDWNGDIKWQKSYDNMHSDSSRSVQLTSDSGYVIAGTKTRSSYDYDSDIWILKVDSKGDIQWQKSYGGAGNDGIEGTLSIHQTTDDGYIIAGITESFGVGSYDLWILKLDSSGSIQWQKTYGGTNSDYAHSIQQTSDGGYIMSGRTSSFAASSVDQDAWILKLDSNGSIEWQKIYKSSFRNDVISSIQQTKDGGYIAGGTLGKDGDAAGLILKLDSKGDVQWQKTYYEIRLSSIQSIQQTTDGGFIANGSYSDAYAPQLWVLKLDDNGNIGNSCSIIGTPNVTVMNTGVSPVNSSATVTNTNATVTTTAMTTTNVTATAYSQCSSQ